MPSGHRCRRAQEILHLPTFGLPLPTTSAERIGPGGRRLLGGMDRSGANTGSNTAV